MPDEKFYTSYDHGDRLTPGRELKVHRRLYIHLDEAGEKQYPATETLSQLITYSPDELSQLRKKSADQEAAIYQRCRETTMEWEKQAAQTQLLDMALEYIEYAKTPAVEHSSNEWVADEYGNYSISNRVYRMNYRIYEETSYDTNAQQSVPFAWKVSWYVNVQNPGKSPTSGYIAGQTGKRYMDKAAAEKYLQGRIKAYSHLFTEILPPVPKEYAQRFCIHGQLLPGYTLEMEQGKTPVHTQTDNTKNSQSSRKNTLARYRIESR